MYLERKLTIDATPDAVWAVLGQFMHIDRFAPQIVSVEALSAGADGLGSKRRNHFANATSVVEEVTAWKPGQGYSVELSEMDKMPLHRARADIEITPVAGRSSVTWSFDFRVKFGPLGWLLGQTMMKMMMGKIIDANLAGLAETIRKDQSA